MFHGRDNGRVKVQYIQNHRMVVKTKEPVEESADDIENIEYLDENVYEESVVVEATHNMEKDDGNLLRKKDQQLEDPFYPNAIFCLLALYREKYIKAQRKNDDDIEEQSFWEAISKEMNESYFSFSAEQLKQKFTELKQHYFNNISTVDEIESFVYFDQMHEIYQDRTINEITSEQGAQYSMLPKKITSQDEHLLQDNIIIDDKVKSDNPSGEDDYKNVPKSDENNGFFDMVQKELKIMEGKTSVMKNICNESNIIDGTVSEDEPVQEKPTHKPTIQTIIIKREKSDIESLAKLPAAKQIKLDISPQIMVRNFSPVPPTPSTSSQSTPQTQAINFEPAQQNTEMNSSLPKEMSLAEYNVHQERRHQEKMNFWEKNLKIQERALELQQKLIEELIKRVK